MKYMCIVFKTKMHEQSCKIFFLFLFLSKLYKAFCNHKIKKDFCLTFQSENRSKKFTKLFCYTTHCVVHSKKNDFFFLHF